MVDQSPTEVKRKMKKQKTSCAEVPVDSSQRIEKKKKKLKKERKTTEGVDDGNGSLPNESPLNVKRKPRSQNPEQDPVTKSSKRKAEKSSDSLQNKSKRKTKKSKTEENGETKEPSNQKIEDLQSVDEVAAGSNSAKESLQSRRDETPAEDLSVEAQPTHKTEPNSESLPQQNFKKSSTQRAFRRVSNEDWIGKKNLYDNSYEATFGNSGWGAKAQKVLGTFNSPFQKRSLFQPPFVERVSVMKRPRRKEGPISVARFLPMPSIPSVSKATTIDKTSITAFIVSLVHCDVSKTQNLESSLQDRSLLFESYRNNLHAIVLAYPTQESMEPQFLRPSSTYERMPIVFESSAF